MSDSVPERAGEPEIATTTLAEIYVQQGLIDRALAIYRRLAERSPGDSHATARVGELEREIERQRAAAPVAPEPTPRAVAEPHRSASPAAEDAEFLAWLESR